MLRDGCRSIVQRMAAWIYRTVQRSGTRNSGGIWLTGPYDGSISVLLRLRTEVCYSACHAVLALTAGEAPRKWVPVAWGQVGGVGDGLAHWHAHWLRSAKCDVLGWPNISSELGARRTDAG